MVMLSVNFGVLTGFILSIQVYLDYHVVPILGIIWPIVYFRASLLLPESTPYLRKRSQLNEAEKSFRYYTNQRENLIEQQSKADFLELQSAILAQQANSPSGFSYKDLITKSALKGFAAATVLCTGFQFSGIFSFINYMSDIFVKSGSVLDVNTCTIIIGVVQIFVDKVGRCLLMLISTLGVGIGCNALGCFTYFGELYDLSDFNWVPLVLMIFIIYVANAGLVGLFFLVIVEVYPAKIRSFATSVSVLWMSLLVFITLKIFPLLLHNWGISITM